MRGLIKLFSWIFRGLGSIKSFIPASLAGLFIVSNFFSTWIELGLEAAFTDLAQKVAGAELTIRENVTLAINNSPQYGLINLFEILISVYILFVLVKFLGKLMIGITGSQAQYMAYVYAIGVVAIIEISTLRVITGEFFIPIWDGVIYLLFNLKPVFGNIHGF